MHKINSFYRNARLISVLSVIFSVLFVVTVVQAATTIGSNISTDGTVSVTGLTSLGQASSTRFSVFDTAYFGGSATSTFSSTGALSLISTLNVTGVTTLTGNLVLTTASSTGTVKFSTINSDTGAISFSDENLTTTGAMNFDTASSTGATAFHTVKVSSVGDVVSDIQHGTCTVTIGSITASSTAMATCTATGVTTSHKVFVTPYITNNGIFMVSASSTADNTIQIAIHNVGYTGAVDPADNVWSWMALR